MKPLDGRHLKNARGSAFVQALAAIAVVGILLYWLSPRVIKHREQVVKTASIITARLALHSMLDYTLLGIKQRWCFSESWMPESCGKNTTEILSHPRSVERILMKGDTVTFLRTMGLIKAGQNVDLDSISTTINIQNFTSLHPVYRIIADLKSVKVSSIKTTISRARKGLVPEYGREVYLQVTVQLLNEAGVPLQVGSSKLEATSFVGVYPREVGSFALLVPGDLHLDSKSSSGGKDGDLYIKNFSSRADFEKSSSGGLIFDSPVFVNGNLVLPKDQADASGDTNYTPVSFKEKVILGDGVIMRDGDEFKPRPTVDYEQFWTSIREFGGFLKGVDVDGSRDLGLDVLAGKSIPGSGDVNLMQMCIRRTQAMNDLSKTANSKLYGRLQNQLGKKFDYRLGMDFLNRFTRQRGQAEAPNANYRNLLVESKSKIKGENGAIASYRLEFGDLKVTGDLPDNGSVSIAPKVDLRPLENSLTSATSRLRDSISDLGGDISRLQSQIRSLQDDIGDAQNALEAEKRKTTPDASKISNLNSRISSLRDSVQNKQDSIAAKKAGITDAENKLSSSEKQLELVRSNMNLQPVINMKMDVPNPDKGSNPSFKDFHVSFENGEVLVDSMGNPLPIKIYLQAYDVGYDQGNSLRSNWKDMQTNGWIVFNRQGVDFVASNTVLDSRGASRGDLPEGDINQDVDGVCANVGTSSSTAFGGVDWLTSFAGNARHSWSFTNSYDSRTNYTFNSGNASLAAKTATFVIKSTARVCTIESTADFVAGFLVCDELVIAPRTTKLRIVGSIIVMKKLIIADEALKAGIRWSTIYQPMATFELRQAGVLVGQNGVACDSINRFPVWHPVPSITDVSNLYRCNAIALRSKADPFRWTSVDPDCGLVPNANSTKCKGHMVNFFVLEVSRESGI